MPFTIDGRIQWTALCLTMLVSLTSLGFSADDTPSPATDPAEAPTNLAATQEAIEMKYRRFEGTLQQLSEYLRKTDPARAELLVRAIGRSKEGRIPEQMQSLTDLLKKDQLGDAVERQELVVAELQSLLELLMSEARKDDLEIEKKRIQDLIKDVTKLIGKESEARAETERGSQIPDLQDRQKQIAESTQKLVQKIQSQDAAKKAAKNDKGSKPSEESDQSKPGEGESDAENSKDKPKAESDESESPKGDKKPKPGEGESGKGKPSDQKPSDSSDDDKKEPNEKKPGDEKPSDDDKPKPDQSDSEEKDDSKGGKSQQGKPSKSKPKDGKPQEGKPSGKPQEGQQQDQPPQDQPPQDSPDQQNQAQEEQDEQQKPSDKTPGRDELQRARQEMDRAIEELKKNNKKGASDKQDKAIAELMKAKEKLEEILRQVREEERELVLAQMEARFRDMLQKQEIVYNATLAIHSIPPETRTDRHRNRSVELARNEDEIAVLAAKALTLLKEEGSSIAFPEAVEQIRDDMLTIARRLERVDVGEITQNIEQDTIESLKELIESLQKELEKLKDKKQSPQQQQQQQQQQSGLVEKLAEMKMLRSLQYRVNRRTKQLGRLVEGEQALDQDVLTQLRQLSDRQAKVQKATYDLSIKKNQ
ncbi:coiled-coil domain-containing protein [Schlesneria paludicola]|uniref:hypothetical protein n=1 Tax=Schlesneria paludicola TaxID=360056 RepID=UPI00029A32AB|nr:hypothetical protein [Schlesneria paludicola]